MIRTRTLLSSAAAAAALACVSASAAQGAVTVVGGGLAEVCSKAVQAGRGDMITHDVCSRSLTEEPLRRRDRAATHVNRGIVSMRMNRYEVAAKDFDRAVSINPNVGEAYVNRGAVLIYQEQYDRAVQEIDRGIALGLEEVHKAYYNRALAREKLDDVRGAYFDLRKAAELAPEWTLPQEQLVRFTVVDKPTG